MKRTLLFLTLIALGLSAQTFEVGSTAELRSALTAAYSNSDAEDIIRLDAGTYRTTDDNGGYFYVRNVTLIGATDGETILDGDFTDTVIYGYNSRLENLTVAHGDNANDSRRGAGITGSSFTLINCQVINNTGNYWATYSAGLHGDDMIVINSLFADNTNSNYGAHIYGHNITSINSVYIGQESIRHIGVYDSGVYDTAQGQYVASPGILSNNAFVDSSFYLQYGGTAEANLEFESAQISALFVNATGGDYALAESSALINAGSTDVRGITPPSTDISGNPRVVGASVDIGPYEFQESGAALTALTIVHTGDFNADGTADLLTSTETGFNLIYIYPDGRTSTRSINIPATATLRSFGDFNADGTTDFLVQYEDGDYRFWYFEPSGAISISAPVVF